MHDIGLCRQACGFDLDRSLHSKRVLQTTRYWSKFLFKQVPRRKAVYRFTKFDYLKQKEAEIIRHEDFPGVDFGGNQTLDFGDDDKSEGEASLAAEVDGDDDDTPLESLLAEKYQQAFQAEKCTRLPPVETECSSYECMDNNGTTCASFYDYHNNNNNNAFSSSYEDYYVPCSEVITTTATQYGRQNYPSYIKNGAYEPLNYSTTTQCYYPAADCNNNYPQCDGETGGHLASLLLNSILMTDHQTVPDSTTQMRDAYTTVPISCTSTSGNISSEAIVSSSLAQMKMEPTESGLLTTPAQLQDIDTDSAWNTLKEFEKLLMINRSFWTKTFHRHFY